MSEDSRTALRHGSNQSPPVNNTGETVWAIGRITLICGHRSGTFAQQVALWMTDGPAAAGGEMMMMMMMMTTTTTIMMMLMMMSVMCKHTKSAAICSFSLYFIGSPICMGTYTLCMYKLQSTFIPPALEITMAIDIIFEGLMI